MLAAGGVFPEEIACVRAFFFFTRHLLCAVLLFTTHAHCKSNKMSQSI